MRLVYGEAGEENWPDGRTSLRVGRSTTYHMSIIIGLVPSAFFFVSPRRFLEHIA